MADLTPPERAAGTTFDPWYEHYAARTSRLGASEVRALFAVASRPEVVSLAGGMPFVSAIPPDHIVNAVSATMRDHGPAALQYGSGQGDPALRSQIREVMALEGIDAGVDDIVVTTGSQQAIDLVTKLLIDPGDVIVVEAPSYVGALGVFRSYQAEVAHAQMDDKGLIPQALRDTIDAIGRSGKRIKFLYTIPTFQNPAGVTLSEDRRPEILEICRRHKILVVEDNPYGLLSFDGSAPPALRSYDDAGIIYLGTFSKTLAPGFRIGWALAPLAIREKLILASESAILSPSSFSQLVIAQYLGNSDWKGQIDQFNDIYRERLGAMLSALSEHLPELSWTNPTGGFFVWLTLPRHLDSQVMLARAVKERVAYIPGTAFYFDGAGHHNIRLSFSYPPPESIRTGVRRLASVIAGELDLLGTFAGTGPLEVVEHDRHFSSPPPNLD